MAQRAFGGPAGWPLLAFLGFAALSLLVYRQALHGPFVSDDLGYLGANPYTASLSAESIGTLLDPRSEAKLYTANYAPLHLLLHAFERQIFADETLGYHLVNVAIHAACAALLAALLAASGVPRPGALLGAALFALHPANVEAVAWISQLKTVGALALALAALLAWGRRPGLATVLFALALLTKASAAAALPMAAALSWARRSGVRHRIWLAVQVAVLALYAIPQWEAMGRVGGVEVAAFADPFVQLRTVAAVGTRYLVMAATGYGVSAFQEPAPSTSWLDPWWLAALPLGALLAWRTLRGLVRRREEAAWWIGAAAAFAPVSQVFPFLNPVADRYLYFLLPGLIGGTLLAAGELGRRRGALGVAGLAAGAALAAVFAIQSSERARLWSNPTLLYLDAAEHYPDGGTAWFLRARRAAAEGDVGAAVDALRRASERGIDTYLAIWQDPAFARFRRHPDFVAVVREIAGRWLDSARRRGYSTQAELRAVAQAHWLREEYAEAEAALEAGLAAVGPQEEQLRRELAQVRERIAAGEARRGDGGAGDRERQP